MRNDVAGLRALVTGAGSGVGRACALRLAELGLNVVAVGRTTSRLEETRSLAAEPSHVTVRALDVADLDEVDALRDWLAGTGGLDVLMNNAGTLVNTSIDETSVEDFDRVIRTNLRGTFIMCKELLGLLRASSAGTVINMGSAASHNAYPNQTAYGASKHGVLGLSKSLARELLADDVRVHVISPGGIATEMLGGNVRSDLADQQLMLPDDIADMVEYLLTHRNGAVIDELCPRRCGKEPFPYC